MTIHLLDEQVIAKIAAGEVVERPASVVKELLENSLDAGATFIQIDVAEGGRKLIRISDDGHGILSQEVQLAVQRHATSKLASADDLYQIETLGFRGEALASIAAVSRFMLVTRHRDETVGTRLRIDGGQVVDRRDVGVPAGTTITVEGLFYNVPARLKFMKAEATEKRQISTLVMNYAMAYPDVRFVLTQDGREVFRSVGSGQLQDVVVKVLGLSHFRQMLEVSGEDVIRGHGGRVSVVGYVSTPELHRKDRTKIIMFVNGRAIQDSNLSYAVTQAYHMLMPAGRHPVAVLMVRVPPDFVDVNVHPTKAEVRFQDAGAVFAAVQRAVREGVIRTVSPLGGRRRDTFSQWDDLPESRGGQMALGWDDPGEEWAEDWAQQRPASLAGQAAIVDENGAAIRPRTLPPLRVVGQVGAAYIVAEGPAGMYLIDQHGAHHRILYEELREVYADAKGLQSKAVEAQTFDMSPQEMRLLENHHELVASLGVIFEPFGTQTVIVRALPELLAETEPAAVIAELLPVLLDAPEVDMLLKQMAQLAAIRSGAILNIAAMQDLVRQLERCPSPQRDPYDRPTFIHLSAEQLAREFGR